MFRAVAYAAQVRGIALDDEDGLRQLVRGLQLVMCGDSVLLNGDEVSPYIRSTDMSVGASVVARSPVVRHYLAEQQRQIAADRNMVTEGRDQGTVVFPYATCKFFLTADPEVRLLRRVRDLEQRKMPFDLEDLRRTQVERDHRDATRPDAPMRPAEDAFILDTTDLTIDQVLDRMETEVRRRLEF